MTMSAAAAQRACRHAYCTYDREIMRLKSISCQHQVNFFRKTAKNGKKRQKTAKNGNSGGEKRRHFYPTRIGETETLRFNYNLMPMRVGTRPT